ncbi:hypothetical protein OAW32_00075 [bacterium]|nr:hypothetical protein [bacterium]
MTSTPAAKRPVEVQHTNCWRASNPRRVGQVSEGLEGTWVDGYSKGERHLPLIVPGDDTPVGMQRRPVAVAVRGLDAPRGGLNPLATNTAHAVFWP